MLKDTGDGPISGFVLNNVLDCFGRKHFCIVSGDPIFFTKSS